MFSRLSVGCGTACVAYVILNL